MGGVDQHHGVQGATHPPSAKADSTVKIQTFDPKTFYPALSAREKMKTRTDSEYPNKSVHEPVIPKDFDPAVFYPALAAQEKARIMGREDSVLTNSSYPSSSFNHGLPVVPERMVVQHPEIDARVQKRRQRKRLWTVGTIMAVITVIIILVFAWLGAHNWFKDQPVTIP